MCVRLGCSVMFLMCVMYRVEWRCIVMCVCVGCISCLWDVFDLCGMYCVVCGWDYREVYAAGMYRDVHTSTVENTGSRPITDVKQGQARSVT